MKQKHRIGVNEPLHYAFVDESGTAAPFSGSHFLVIALLSTTRPRPIELHVKRAHKKYGTSLASGEMKASVSREMVVEQLLQAIAQEPAAIMAVIVDKRAIVRPPGDPEDIYREAVTRAVRHAVSRWPRIDVCLDKRYTTRRLRYRLEKEIREGIVETQKRLTLGPDFSLSRRISAPARSTLRVARVTRLYDAASTML